MLSRIFQFHRDERGTVVIMIGAILALLLVFGVWAIDASQMFLVRTQLQNAADAGALAGAAMMGMTGDSVAAVDGAIIAAGANEALISTGTDNVMGSVVISAADITFPNSGQIRVTTHRTDSTGDPFINYFLEIFDPSRPGEMTASAAAGFEWVCGAKCVMPWAPPDRWDDLNGDEGYDPGEPYDPVTTGYTDADLGAPITLVLGHGGQTDFEQFWYYAINFPPMNKGNPIPGGDQYREWMCTDCLDASFTVEPGDSVQVEPGHKVGPNGDGLDCIVGSDPTAEWDEENGRVINSAYPISPRIVKAALFDPSLGLQYDLNGRPYLVIVKIMVVFIESRRGNDQITGRFMRLAEPGGVVCQNQSDPSFLFKTSLIE
ncbi:MAG: pilus assembly protein TadG-related protein [Candidatus Zixiibacteriota bacterium]